MTWSRVDSSYRLHPKIIGAGLEAMGLDVASWGFCNDNGTDGFVPKDRLREVYPLAKNLSKIAKRLVEVGRWEWDEKAQGWWVHDFLDYNFSADEVAERKRRRAESGRKGGIKSGKTRAERQAFAQANGSAQIEANASALAQANGEPDSDSGSNSRLGINSLTDENHSNELGNVAARMSLTCRNPNTGEALQVVEALSEYVDLGLIDQCVGWAGKLDHDRQPKSPRYFLTAVRDWAGKSGITIPETVLKQTRLGVGS